MQHFKVLVLGSGSGGLAFTSKLLEYLSPVDVAIVDPSTYHYYQPFWTLVGGGVGTKEETRKENKDLIPDGVTWFKQAVSKVNPEKKSVTLVNDQNVSYDYLIVSTGLKLNWDKIDGLTGNLGKNGVCSIYEYDQVDYVKECLKNMKAGVALFIMPPTPIKCAGAPQKIMYLADSMFRQNGVRDKVQVHFAAAGKVIFGVPEFAKALDKVVKEKNIQTHFMHKLIGIDAAKKTAIFDVTAADGTVTKKTMQYDILHVVPSMSAHNYVAESGLAVEEGDLKGWLAVNKFTLQHLKYPNIFGLGDVTGVPNSKTGAAIRKQYPVVVKNLISAMNGMKLDEAYDGYSSCPLIVDFGKVVLAEFGYENKLMPSFPFDQTIPRKSMWILKRWLLPVLYWYGMVKGRF
jgi:sulfide:quinone oxidoreductase